MTKPQKKEPATGRIALSRQVGVKEKRMLKAKHGKARSIWLGLGMLGLIGWSVAIPTLLGIALGIWIDNHFPSRYSWTLMLLLIGLVIGCVNVWHWVANEYREIRKEREENNHHEPR
jgi:ATP synthase protein I